MEDFESIWDHSYSMMDGECKVLVHEDFDAGLGGTLFDGSIALSAYIENQVKHVDRDKFTGKQVIELGAGCGFPGLFVAKLGAGRVILSDMGDHVALLQENIELNKLQANCEARSLDWTSETDLRALVDLGIKFDYILCADVVYAEHFVDPLLHVLREIATPGHTQILFSHPKARIPKSSEMFWERLAEHFTLEKVPAANFVAGWQPGNKQFLNAKEGIFILKLT